MSLVDTMLAIMVLSIVLLGIMAAITTTLSVSRSTGQVAATRNALASVVERASAAGFPGCEAAATVDTRMKTAGNAAFVEAPPGYTFEVTSVRSAYPEGACSAASRAVMLDVSVTHTETGTSADGQVVVRDKTWRPA